MFSMMKEIVAYFHGALKISGVLGILKEYERLSKHTTGLEIRESSKASRILRSLCCDLDATKRERMKPIERGSDPRRHKRRQNRSLRLG